MTAENKTAKTENKTANMDKVKAELKAWTSYSSEVRYYVNDWKNLAGVSVDYYNTGNVRSVFFTDLNGEEQDMSNSYYYRKVASGKVYFDDTGMVHVDYVKDDVVRAVAEKKVLEHFM
ncbi:MAG: hypothetical protein WC096_00480 [Sphaerochaetaceae bacterium]